MRLYSLPLHSLLHKLHFFDNDDDEFPSSFTFSWNEFKEELCFLFPSRLLCILHFSKNFHPIIFGGKCGGFTWFVVAGAWRGVWHGKGELLYFVLWYYYYYCISICFLSSLFAKWMGMFACKWMYACVVILYDMIWDASMDALLIWGFYEGERVVYCC